MSANPFVGPRPLSASDVIFGRTREIRELLYLFTAERIVLLYSPSGAGKSSLINAKNGLLDKMKARFDVWPPTRVNLAPVDGVANRYAWSAAMGFEQRRPDGERRRAEELAGLSLPEAVGKVENPTVLVFDQFEEILRVDPQAMEAKREFFRQAGQLLIDPNLWALFVIREEFLAPLDTLAKLIPTHLQHRFRLNLFSLATAEEAMSRNAESGGRTFAPDARQKLVRDLSTVKIQQPDGSFVEEAGTHVEPMHLQVACRGLWERMPDGDLSIDLPDVEQFGKVSEALADYYASQVQAISNGDVRRERILREWVATHLITGNIRSQVRKGKGETEGLPNEEIDSLVSAHLVRAEQRSGAFWFELAHDRLVTPVQLDNEKHLARTARLARLWNHEKRQGGLLAKGPDLAEAKNWATQNAGAMTLDESAFIEQSIAAEKVEGRERFRLRMLKVATGVSILLALTSIAGLFYANDKRRAVERIARAALLRGFQDAHGKLRLENWYSLPSRTLLNIELLRRNPSAQAQTALMEEADLLPQFERRYRLPDGQGVIGFAVTRDGKDIVATDGKGRVHLLDGQTATVLYEQKGEILGINQPNGNLLTTASADEVIVYDLAARKIYKQWRWPARRFADRMGKTAISANGTHIAVALDIDDYHRNVEIYKLDAARNWDLFATRTLTGNYEGPMSFTGDGQYLAMQQTGMGRDVSIFSIRAGFPRLWSQNLSDEINSLTFGPQGRELLVYLNFGQALAFEWQKQSSRDFGTHENVDGFYPLANGSWLHGVAGQGHATIVELRASGVAPALSEVPYGEVLLADADRKTAYALVDLDVIRYRFGLPAPKTVEEICARLESNLSLAEWKLYAGEEPYSATCPGLPTPAEVKAWPKK